MRNKYTPFYKRIFFTIFVSTFIIGISMTSVCIYNYFNTQRNIMSYSVSVASDFVNEKIESYRMEKISDFCRNNVVAAFSEAAEAEFGKRQKIYDILANIYAENKGVQFIYYRDKEDMISVGEGIGDIDKRYAIMDEFTAVKERLPNHFLWRYETVDNGERCIVFCKDIELMHGDYTKSLIGTVCVGLNINDLSAECFKNLRSNDENYICNQFIADSGGRIAVATDKGLIGMNKNEVFDETKNLINNRKSIACIKKGDDWTLVSYIDTGIKSAETVKIILLIIGIVILIMAGIGVAEYFISKRTSKPLEELYYYIQHISIDGKNVNKGRKPDNSEIGQIEEAFNGVIEKLGNEIEDRYKMEIELKKAQLAMYESQMNPHFLYNTLQLIQMMSVMNENENVCSVISSLGQMLNFSLRCDEEIMLEDEIHNIENYFNIIKLRYKDKFTYNIIAGEDVMKCGSIKFLLQPFVENSIKYGFKNKKNDWKVAVLAQRVGDEVAIVVEDNGEGCDLQKLKTVSEMLQSEKRDSDMGTGIWNVHQRLKLKYGKNYGVSIYRSNTKTQVLVHIPYNICGEKGEIENL